MKRIFSFLVVSLAWVCGIHAQIAINETNFPDKNFRNWVLAQDYGADGQLTKAEISDITVIDVSQQNIANLKGIEHFSALLELNCSRNRQMETLDLSNNTELTSLNCDYDQLTALDLSNNVALNIIKCYDNQLTILDVSKNINLVKLDCSGNKLSSLDVSKCGQLSELTCFRNQLTSLDVYSNTALTSLVCYENQLTSLDVSNNPELFRLNCYTNKLTSLDVSKNTKLVKLFCFDNQLTTLDVTNNALLNDLRCYMNKIGEVAMSKLVSSLPIVTNGTFTVKQLDNENDQNYITTIQVATAKGKGWKVYSTDGWYFTDYKGEEPTIYSIIIDATNFPDTNFRNWLLDEANISGNGADGVLTDEEIAGVTTIDVNNLEISDLAGIEFFTALTTLNCRFTKITSIDLSRNTVLKNLDCRNNTLTALNVANNTALTALRCSRNKITSLDVSKNTELTVLRCNYNQLTALDVSQNTKLEQLDCFGNKIGKTAMGNLVASLPNVTNGKLYVIDTTWSSEENICTTNQVNAAKAKGWIVYDNHGGNAVEYAGAEPTIEPVETVDFGNDIDDDTNLNGNVVGDVLYNISSDGGSYSDVEGCIVVTKPTDDTAIDGQDIFGEDFKDNYNGIVFKVPAGKGSVKVEAQTTGSMMLKVKIGNNDPVEMALQGKLKVTFPYNVTEATYVYIYGGSGSSNAPGMLGAPSATGGELKLYGIEVDADATGISNVNVNDNDNRYYTLDGQLLQGKPTQKGVYIVNGRKIVIK